ncbi:serine hydrolase domain-containing protein [Thalassotalea litorea]|uniref:serine hydrolase domain-containing protein n=1 Tax=Thalassotalea litorea TaxID=2020715 RepID=UPI0037357AC3
MIIRNAIISLALTYSTASIADEINLNDIDAVFSNFNANGPGCSVAITQNGKTIFDKGYGLSNLEYSTPITSDNRFLIGSTSKQFTAYAIALLVEEEKISLTDSLSKFFPQFPEYAKRILVSDLIHHTSGIRDMDHLTYLGGFGESIDYTDKDAMTFLTRQEALNFNPGEEYMYSNSNYYLLAKIVEVVTKQSFREFTTENIFKPLGMNHSHFNDSHTEVIKLRASGYWPSDKSYSLAFNTMDIVGASGLYTTNKDLQVWFSAFLEGISGTKNKNIFREMVKVGKYRNGKSLHYAFGLEVDSFNGMQRIHHGGGDAGYRAMSMIFPAKKTAFGILCNDGYVNTMNLAQKLSNVVFEVQGEDTQRDEQHNKIIISQVTNFLGDYWSDELKQKISLTKDNDSIFYLVNNRNKSEVYGHGESTNSFNVYSSDGIQAQLTINPNSSITVMTMRHGLKKLIEYEKVSEGVFSLPSDYTGKYYSRELDSHYKLTATNNGLILNMAGSAPHKLAAIKKGVFSDKYGQIVVTFDSIRGFLLSSTRAKNIVFEKVEI